MTLNSPNLDQAGTPAQLVEPLARVLAVLDLPPDEDSRLLVDRLAGSDPYTILVLSAEEAAAYERLSHRLNLILADGSPLQQSKWTGR
jgi:hypothetical protein